MDYHTSFIKKFKSEEIVIYFDIHRFFLNEVGIDIWNGCIRQYLDLADQENFWLAGFSRRRPKEKWDHSIGLAYGKMSEWNMTYVTKYDDDEKHIKFMFEVIDRATLNNPIGICKITDDVFNCWKTQKCPMGRSMNKKISFLEYNFHIILHLQNYCQIKIYPQKPKECPAEKEVSALEKQPDAQSSLMRELSALLNKLAKGQ